tara:strand:+ start:743 stop:1093 length:351 start_codon:yes stop_codon:yes gene_type:complete
MNNEKSIAPRFLNILEHYMTIVERENDELKIKVKQLELYLDEPYGDEQVSELKAEIKRLKADNDNIKRCNKTMDAILLEREAEIKELKADIKHDADVCYDLDDKHVEEIKRLNERV